MPFTQDYHDQVSEMSIGESFTAYDSANAYLGVGNSNTAFAASQSDLQGANKTRKGMETGFPNRVDANSVEFEALFDENEANYEWREHGLFNAETGGTMLYREVENLGTKAQGTIWRFTVTVEWLKS